MKNAIKLTLLFSALIFTGCIHMMNEAADNINSASNEPESVSEYNFATQTVDSLFQLDLPKYMKNIPSLHDEASLEYGNMLKAAYTIVIHEDKHEFVENIEVSSSKLLFQNSFSCRHMSLYMLLNINLMANIQILHRSKKESKPAIASNTFYSYHVFNDI